MQTLTGPAIDFFRLITVIRAIEVHIKTGGKMMLTRVATPANLRAIATEFTGKGYARSRKGLETALADLTVLKQSMTA